MMVVMIMMPDVVDKVFMMVVNRIWFNMMVDHRLYMLVMVINWIGMVVVVM